MCQVESQNQEIRLQKLWFVLFKYMFLQRLWKSAGGQWQCKEEEEDNETESASEDRDDDGELDYQEENDNFYQGTIGTT